MSLCDEIYVNMCRDIIENGTSTKGQKVRPKWPDGEAAYTIKRFGIVNRYDLRREFPAITLRKTAIISASDEILWIYQKKSNNIADLNSHIWDEWADENGSIGKAYGYQIGTKYLHHSSEDGKTAEDNAYPSVEYRKGASGRYDVYMDQMDAVLWELKHTPYSRRIMTNMWNPKELHEMGLYPCAYSATFNVTDEGYDRLVLNMVLNQRSQDVLAAGNWNPAQYAVFLMMVAQCVDMIPGELVHMIADAHIYDRHIPIIKELIERERHPAPKVYLTPDIKDFYAFTRKDVHVEDYVTGPQVENIPIAV